jgi:hypothetical protein
MSGVERVELASRAASRYRAPIDVEVSTSDLKIKGKATLLSVENGPPRATIARQSMLKLQLQI